MAVQVAVDATSTANIGDSSLLICSHTVADQDSRLLLVFVATPNKSIASVTFNGFPLALKALAWNEAVDGVNNDDPARVECWAMIDPPVGTFDIVVTPSITCRMALVATSYYNVDQVVPFGTFHTNLAGPPATSISTDVTAISNYSLVVDGVALERVGSGGGWAAGAGQTLLGNDVASSTLGVASTKQAGAIGTVTMDGTTSAGSCICQIAVEVLDVTHEVAYTAGPSSASSNFLREARRYDAPMTALVRVTLTSPSAKTIFLSTNFVETPDFQLWEAGIVALSPIQDPGSYLSPGPDLSTFAFSLASRHGLGFQVAGKNISNLFADYRWQGAKVEVFLWSRRLTSFGDALLRFTGVVSTYKVASDVCEVQCTQRNDWDRIISPRIVARDAFPRCPDRSVGLPLPIVYGAIKTPPLRNPPWTSDYSPVSGISPVQDIESIGGGPIGIPGVVVDTGRGGSQRQRVILAGHKVKSLNDPAAVTRCFVRDNDLLVPLDPSTFVVGGCSTTSGNPNLGAGTNDFLLLGIRQGMPLSASNIPAGTYAITVTSSNIVMSQNASATQSGLSVTFTAAFNSDGDGAGFEMADDFDGAYYPIQPVDVVSGISSPGDDLRFALDPFNEVNFTKLTYQPSPLIDKRRGAWRLPDISPPGDFALNAFVRVLWKSSGTLTNFKVGIHRVSDNAETLGALTASTTPTRGAVSVGGVDWSNGSLPTVPWAWSECYLVAYWDVLPGARQDVWIYGIGLRVQYKPKARVWAPGIRLRPARHPSRSFSKAGRQAELMDPSNFGPPDTEIEGDFFGTLEGIADDVTGTYTGVAGALVERPPDIAVHLLRNYGGQLIGQINSAVSSFGSFVDARAPMKNWKGADWVSGLQIAEISGVGTSLEALAKAGMSQIYIDPFTDKFMWIPWAQGQGSEYNRKVYRDDLIEFHAEMMTARKVPSGIKVVYGYDAHSRQFTESAYVSTAGSRAGHRYLNLRDESLKITTGVNDKLEFNVSGVSGGVATIAAGDYGRQAFVTAVDAALESAGGSHDYMVCTPERVVAGYNDKLDINDGAVKVATVAPSTYTMESLASAVAAALNAVSSGWTCVYSRATRKFTIDRSSGTKTLLKNTGANKATTAYVNLGYSPDAADVTAGSAAAYEVEENRVVICCLDGAIDLLFASGTYGNNNTFPKTCAEALGFDGSFDRDAAGARQFWMGDSPKGSRESDLTAAAAAYGQTRELVIEGRAIYETDTARELRNRMVDILKEPRVIVRWRTTRMPDIRRGELVRFEDLDNFGIAYPKQNSNGQWTGKRFRVLTVLQRLGPSFEQEIEAIDND